MDDIFGMMGGIFAGIFGKDHDLTLADERQITLPAIWDPAKVERSVGDFGAPMFDTFPAFDVPRDALLSAGLDPDDLIGAHIDTIASPSSTGYHLLEPEDDGKAIVRYRAEVVY